MLGGRQSAGIIGLAPAGQGEEQYLATGQTRDRQQDGQQDGQQTCPLVAFEHVGKGQGEKSLHIIYQSLQPGPQPQEAPKISPSLCKPVAEKPG